MMKNTIAALLVVIVAVGTFSTSTITIIQSAEALADPNNGERTEPKAPMAVSQDGNMAITSMLYGGLTGQETGK
jgi:hypothetical protein